MMRGCEKFAVVMMEGLERLQGEVENLCKLPAPCRLAVVKSNICGYYPPSTAILSQVLDYLSERCAEVYIGDTPSTIHDVEPRLGKLGLRKLAEETGRNVKAVDFMKVSPAVRLRVPRPHACEEYPIPRVVVEAEVLVNVAKFGRHPSTTITAALKNLFGIVASKMKYYRYHIRGMDNVVADIAQIIKPSVNVVEVGRSIVVSRDPLVADVASALIYDTDPLKVRHLKLVAEDRDISLGELVRLIKETVS